MPYPTENSVPRIAKRLSAMSNWDILDPIVPLRQIPKTVMPKLAVARSTEICAKNNHKFAAA
jgi:hypothetical protein